MDVPITQKGTNVPMMRTRAKQKHVASDRARRENVPRHILFHVHKKMFDDKFDYASFSIRIITISFNFKTIFFV